VYLSRGDVIVAVREARVPVSDRGFLYGDAVFETLRTQDGGAPVHLGEHLARLRRSAGALGIEVPWSDPALEAILHRTHAATGYAETRLRVVVTRGEGSGLLDPIGAGEPLLVVIAAELVLPTPEAYAAGVSAICVDAVRCGSGLVAPFVKCTPYLTSIQALRQARAGGATEAIFSTVDGAAAEGATSNLFLIRGGEVVTPGLDQGILPGIVRASLLRLLPTVGISCHERRVPLDELRDADELFLTSSVRGVMAITRLDGRPVGPAQEGPLTTRIRHLSSRAASSRAVSPRAGA
jgi:branched-chain amino acid aminotransferase